ncbi:choice-of-anchor I family protein [Microbacterium dauci]|uniref:Choice-of-anchor I family protein n=1 Tax=Microbacterium dauci TaxID=3048008 RepID=A0ABT6ZDX2_9MICO|nr:choice-of-anchor I family protein [Microbacterium sp. LX3-4]MDJ1114355.1 choice-of-anchor I family protein [Microbacterium sp. LX3-4]
MPSHAFRRSVALGTAAALTCTLAVVTTPATAALVTDRPTTSAAVPALELTPIGTYETGIFDESAAEIVQAYKNRLFVVNAQAGVVDVLDNSDPTKPVKLFSIAADGVANSVAIREDGLGVIAIEAPTKTDDGHLVFFDADATAAADATLGTVPVGPLPDMVTISADGAYAAVANEGEPADDFSIDPEGSVAVVALPDTKTAPATSAVRTADFHAFEAPGALHEDVRVFGPTPHGADNPVSRNLEPEYITTVGTTAYVTLQEANAIAVVDLVTATVTDVHPLGFKDHGLEENALDPSDRDDTVELRTYEGLKGIYMPDAIDSYTAGDTTYLVTANEGDAREWGTYVEGTRAKNIADDGYGPVCATSPLADFLGDEDLGRLNVTTENGFNEGDGCYDELYAFGARSFSIWTTDGELVWDSGSSFEEITAAAAPEFFNSNHSESNLEGRSEDKGPEPETVVIGELSGRTYAFVGFERVGGVAAYDVTDPTAPTFVTYVNNRDFSESVEDGGDLAAAGDLGPESIAFIDAADSPNGSPLLAVGNEVSGTTTVFEVTDFLDPIDIDILTINDFHGRLESALNDDDLPSTDAGDEAGAARIAGAVNAAKAENPNTLFVSAGDNIGASTFTSFIQQDNPSIDALVAAGLDVSAVGNHEFDGGWADLRDRVIPRFGGTDFALGANVYAKGTKTPVLPEYTVKTVDGVRVAFIGTVTTDTATMVAPDGIADIEFGDQLEAANRAAKTIEDGDLADVVVLLTHSGTATSNQCATVASDPSDFGDLARGADASIDAIVSAHTHQTYACEIPVEGTDDTRPVIQAAEYGKAMGELQLQVDRASKSLLSIEGSTFTLADKGYEADAEVAEIVADAVAVAEEEGAVPVGTISADILRGGATPGSDRGVESTLGNAVADWYLWATSNDAYAGTPAQIALMNPGGLRADLLFGTDGTVTYKQVAEVQPFANTLVTVTLTGAQIEEILEQQWKAEGERPKLHLGVSEGFAYEYTEIAPLPGETVGRGGDVTSMTFEGEAIAADDEFTVVTNSFLAAGGDGFATFAEGTDRTDTGQVDLAATVAYFAAHDEVAPGELGRAALADESVDPEPTPEPTLPGTGDDDATGDDDGSGSDDAAGEDGAAAGDDELANTGGDIASMVTLLTAAALLIALGTVLVLRRRRQEA